MFEFPDPELERAMEMSRVDPEQAAEVLRIAAKHLRNQEQLPSALAYFLADAFEKAMKKASIFRGSELLIHLNLKVSSRRPTANYEHVGFDMDKLFLSKIPKLDALGQVANIYSIDESTVKRMYKKYLKHKAIEWEVEDLDHEEELRNYSEQSPIKKSD